MKFPIPQFFEPYPKTYMSVRTRFFRAQIGAGRDKPVLIEICTLNVTTCKFCELLQQKCRVSVRQFTKCPLTGLPRGSLLRTCSKQSEKVS